MTKERETSLHKQLRNHRTVRKCAAAQSRQRRRVKRACLWTEVRGHSAASTTARSHVEKQEPALNIQYSVNVPLGMCATLPTTHSLSLSHTHTHTLTHTHAHKKMPSDRPHLICAWEIGVLSVLCISVNILQQSG